ncbi:hypothetical protein ABFV59_30870 [Pseudomonas silesiensis]
MAFEGSTPIKLAHTEAVYGLVKTELERVTAKRDPEHEDAPSLKLDGYLDL